MSDFPERSIIRLAKDTRLEGEIVTIQGSGPDFTVSYAGQVWQFSNQSGDCALIGGQQPGVKEVLDVEGSCSKTIRGFAFLIGITRDPEGPPDNHVVEWVSEEEG